MPLPGLFHFVRNGIIRVLNTDKRITIPVKPTVSIFLS